MTQQLPFAWPAGPDGQPMAIVIGQITDLVKTAEYCNVQMTSTIMRPVSNADETAIINAARAVQQDAEYVVGCERRLLDMELGKLETVNPAHPVTGERFAGVPAGYDPATMPPHPADAPAQATPLPAPASAPAVTIPRAG